MRKEQLEFLQNKKLTYGTEMPYLNFLFEKIENEYPGTIVCAAMEEGNEVKKFLERGVFLGKTNKMMKGEPSQCHSNSANLYEVNKEEFNVKIMTGYALSDDKIWRQHSWILKDDKKIIETTEKRIAYFGYVLNEEESDIFCEDNCW